MGCSGDEAAGEDLAGPGGLGGGEEALVVELGVDVLEEGEADDAVVGGAVEGDGGGAGGGGGGVEGGYAVGVEDFVYAGILLGFFSFDWIVLCEK